MTAFLFTELSNQRTKIKDNGANAVLSLLFRTP